MNKNSMQPRGLSLLFFLFIIGQALAQDAELVEPRFLMKIAPQNFTQNELKISGEAFLGPTYNKSINISLYGRFYNQQDSYYYYPGEAYTGMGSEISYRKYISPMKKLETRRGKSYLQGIYASGYVQGGWFSSEGTISSYIYPPNGAPVIIASYDIQENVTNMGFGFTIGVNRTLWKVLFIDAYIGGGLQFANQELSETLPQNSYYSFYSDITDPGYQGILPKFGLLIGVKL